MPLCGKSQRCCTTPTDIDNSADDDDSMDDSVITVNLNFARNEEVDDGMIITTIMIMMTMRSMTNLNPTSTLPGLKKASAASQVRGHPSSSVTS